MKLNYDYTFRNYIAGNNNKAIQDIISSAMALPGRISNPIFIYGSIGVGKSHLLQAIAHEYQADLKIRYITTEQFVNDIIQSILDDRYIDFIEQCLSLDVLLIDDIHLVQNKKYTKEELLNIFERLHNAKKQIIITAGMPINRIFMTSGKAVKLFQKGREIEVKPPCYKERLRFLRARARSAGLQLGGDVVKHLARKARPDFRELEGTLAEARFYSYSISSPSSWSPKDPC